VTALLASPWGALACGFVCLAAVATGVYLGAAWDRLTTAARRHYAPGSHRR
jgi:hypothetical protein